MEGKVMIPMLRPRGSNIPNFVDAFFGDDFLSNFFDNNSVGTIPAVNIIENKDEFAIEVAAPGLEKKDFELDIHNNVLSISCRKEVTSEQKDEKFMRREFNYSSFKRSFSIPDGADSDKIKASYKEGVLRVNIPKKEETKEKPPRQISIL